MEKKQQIIIDHFRLGKSQRKISSELGLSRNTVKKYVDQYLFETGQDVGGSVSLEGSSLIQAPCYDSSSRQKRKLTEEVVELIHGYLKANAEKKSQGNYKQEMKGSDIHEALQGLGYEIGYTTVCGYIRQYRKAAKEVYIRQQYQPGEAVEFDWASVKLFLDGQAKKLMLAVCTSCYSNHRWGMLFYRQDMSSFLQAHVSYFSAVGAVTGEMVYDNMRVAVRRFAQKNADKIATEDLLKLSSYYQFGYRFCNRGKGHEKGHVERSVEFIRRKAFAPKDRFESLDQANSYLWEMCHKLNGRKVRGQTHSIAEAFMEEKARMRPTPPAYEACKLLSLRVNKYSCIKVDTNFYSLLEGHVGSWVDVKIYAHRIEVFDQAHQLLAQHSRRNGRFGWYIQLDHYLKTLVKKPGALPRSLAWHQADPRLHELFKGYFTQEAKMFIELLLWARKEKISIEQVMDATHQAAKTSISSPISLDKIQLLATEQIATQFHIPDPNPLHKDPIAKHAAEQLTQIQALFVQPHTQ